MFSLEWGEVLPLSLSHMQEDKALMAGMDTIANRPARIMHFIESGGLYGAESVVLSLAREMLKSSDYIPVVACIVQRHDDSVALYDKALSLGIEAHKIEIHNKRFPWDILRFILLLRALRIDILHSHGYKAAIIGHFSKVILGIPLLPTCHSWFRGKGSPLKFRLMTRVELLLYRFSKIITVVSQPIKDTLVQRGIPPECIRIIKNGVCLDDYAPKSPHLLEKIREDIGIEKSVPVIIHLGRLTEIKAQANIIRASRIMKDRGVQFVVLIVGEGDLRQELEEQIRNLDVKEEVRLLGFREDVSSLLQLAELFLLPSLSEGLPMSLLEAMASKVPVVVTSVGDVPKLLDFGRLGEVIPVNDINAIVDSVCRILAHPESARQAVDAGYLKVLNEFSSVAMFKSYEKLYMTTRNG